MEWMTMKNQYFLQTLTDHPHVVARYRFDTFAFQQYPFPEFSANLARRGFTYFETLNQVECHFCHHIEPQIHQKSEDWWKHHRKEKSPWWCIGRKNRIVCPYALICAPNQSTKEIPSFFDWTDSSFCLVRQKTFEDNSKWNLVPKETIADLAVSGMILDECEKVHCFSCHIELADPEHFVDPFLWHWIQSPSCPYIKMIYVGGPSSLLLPS